MPLIRTRLILALATVAALGLGPLATAALGANGITMNARVMLQGHARVGSWMAIEVRLKNDGPPVRGELQMDGGSQGRTRFALAVDLPTTSDQTYVLHAQPPAFGRSVDVRLVANGAEVAKQSVTYAAHDATQLVVGVLAERPQGIVSEITLPVGVNGAAPAIVQLGLQDLPGRVEGWAALDRLVWQDLDSNKLTSDQLAALHTWIAAGGELVIAGGSAGIGTLSGFPDDLLPYRPTSTLDVAPASLAGLLGTIPGGATDVPAMAGTLASGRALATSGDRAIAARRSYGSGAVTLIGVDPTSGWLGESNAVATLWRSLLPNRGAAGPTVVGDDSNLLRAVQQLPTLAPPSTGGLLLLLAAYIVVIGPINYLLLRRLDRREWAWVTMPLAVVGFAAAAYAYGSVLRGTDLLVNEVAIVRGAPDTTEGSAQVYFGVFSPTKGTYDVNVPSGALLASPLSADNFGQAGTLDILQGGQGEASKVRNLDVGFGSIRYLRGDVATTAPRVRAKLALADGTLTGTLENASDEPLDNVAVVLGGSVASLGHLDAHASKAVSLRLGASNPFGSPIADQVIGPIFSGGSTDADAAIRYTMLQQLTFDPLQGFARTLDADGPVVLAFSGRDVLAAELAGQQARRTANTLYYIPFEMTISGKVTFQGDLLRSTVLGDSSPLFDKQPNITTMGAGTLTYAYRPIDFDGRLQVSEVRVSLSPGGDLAPPPAGKPIEPLASVPVTCASKNQPANCQPARLDPLPEVEVFDLTRATWVRLPRLEAGAGYSLGTPERFVDPGSGQLLVRFVNDNAEQTLGFGFQVSITGVVE